MINLEEAIVFLEQRSSSLPTLDEFACILHKCRMERSLGLTLRVHDYMRKTELDVHAFFGNYLLLMLIEVGSMCSAQQVFNRLVHVDECSWNALISGYVNHQEVRHALSLYGKSHEVGSAHCINAYTFVSLLKACTELKDLEKSIQIHTDVARKGLLEKDLYIGSSLVDTYIKCGCITRAQEVFDDLPARNVVCWTSLIAGYAEHGCGEEALYLYEQMLYKGITPSAITFMCILKICGTLCATSKGQEVHSDLVKLGSDGEIVVGNTLVHMYAKCGLLSTAQKVFDKLPVRDAALWNTLLAGYAEDGCGKKAFELFQEMQHESISADAFTFVCILKACSEKGTLHEGQQIHGHITRKGFERDVFVGSALVDLYAKHGALLESQCVFDKLLVQGVVSWNALLAGYAEHNRLEEALYLYGKMQHMGVPADDITFVCMLKVCGTIGALDLTKALHTDITITGLEEGPFVKNTIADTYAKCGLLEEAQKVIIRSADSCAEHDEVDKELGKVKLKQENAFSPHVATHLCSLKAFASMKNVDEGQKIYGKLVKIGLSANDGFVGSALINMYAKCGLVADAQAVFDRLATKDAVSWTALITGYAEQGACVKVLDCLHQMQLDGISPVAASFVSVLKACMYEGTLVQIHTYIVEKGLDGDLAVVSTLVDMYAKCGLLLEAHNVFDNISSPDVVSWTALIAGYVDNGYGEEAIGCFKQMQQEGVFQSAFTYACILKACTMITHAQLGQELHDEVLRKGLENDLFVGSSLVSMYAKRGLLVEAHGVFDKLPSRSVVAFNAFLAGHMLHEREEEALDILDQMNREGVRPDLSTYICSVKVCGALRVVEKGHSVHAEIVKKGLLDLYLGSSLVAMYTRFGHLVDACQVCNKLLVRDAVTWMTLIQGYVKHGDDMVALECFEQMQYEGVTPVALTFICSLRCCSSLRDINKARELHIDITKKGLDKEHSVGKILVVAYARCARLDEAKKIFEKLGVQDDLAWSALVKGYSGCGQAKEALDCFDQIPSQSMSLGF